jgi:hypothetical protein
MEIRADAVLQADGFADIDDRTLGISHQVTTGFGRQGIQDTLKVLGYFHWSQFYCFLHNLEGWSIPVLGNMADTFFFNIFG